MENFRSVSNSGWIESDNVTALVGVNEAGKSNLLLALWKLNPATGGEINKLEDMPRSKYSEWRDLEEQHTFVTCEFELKDPELIKKLIEVTGCKEKDLKVAKVTRDFNGKRTIGFPNFKRKMYYQATEKDESEYSFNERYNNVHINHLM